MLSLCSHFQIFGDGTDKMILVADGQGYIINNPLLYRMDITQNSQAYDTWLGKRFIVPGVCETNLHFRACMPEIISAADLASVYNPLMQKSVLELMQAVNKKLRSRG